MKLRTLLFLELYWIHASTAFKESSNIGSVDLYESLKFARGVFNKLNRFEQSLSNSDILIKKDTIPYNHLVAELPDASVLKTGKQALLMLRATEFLVNSHCNRADTSKCMKILESQSFLNGDVEACEVFRGKCLRQPEYRIIDGTCNHIDFKNEGSARSAYRRLLPANYLDRLSEMRRSVKNKKPLLSPREISAKLLSGTTSPDDREHTLALALWGEFVNNDMYHTVANKKYHSDETIECCSSSGGRLAPRYLHPQCAPITVPNKDVYYGKSYIQCMNYVRSIAAPRNNCTLGPLEQMNLATSALDLSNIYGSHSGVTSNLRSFAGGHLKLRNNFLQKQDENEFAYKTGAVNLTTYAWSNDITNIIKFSGDARSNFNIQLTSLQTLWTREHNRIADTLSEIYPNWHDETLFEEARRIVIAEYQHITYNQWLPRIVGERIAKNIKSYKFDKDVPLSVSNEYATAASKFVETLVAGVVRLYNESSKISHEFQLGEYIGNSTVLENEGFFDSVIRGLITQNSKKADLLYDKQVHHVEYNNKYGFDLASFNIQRGRDHGLPTYNSMRKYCQLRLFHDFQDLKGVMNAKVIAALPKVYSHVDDVDLLVGGMAELREKGRILGPTFSCIMNEQFTRTRSGDTYFYSNPSQPHPLSHKQLHEIKKSSLARLLCDNTNIKSVRPEVFDLIGPKNGVAKCSQIMSMNIKEVVQ